MTLEQWVLKIGGIASALSAVAGLLWKFLINPRKKRKEQAALARIEHEKEEEAYRNKLFEKLDAVMESLEDTQKDVGYLQMHELKSAHSRLMRQKYCSDEEKAALVALYDRYKSKGRNSLAESFADDILSLPSYPPEKE